MHLRRLSRIPNLPLLGLCQLHIQCAHILIQVLQLLGSGDGNDILTLGHQPSERQLAGSTALPSRDLADPVRELEILGEVLFREAGGHSPEISFFEVVGGLVCSRQHAATEGRVGDDSDAEFAAGFQEADFGVLNVE